jgi:hypothetical protein
MSWSGYGDGDLRIHDRILEERHGPRLKGESRADWLERIAPERQPVMEPRGVGKIVRSADAQPAKGVTKDA